MGEALPRTVAELLARAEESAAGDAVVMPGDRISFPELGQRTTTMARRLLGAGVRPGDRVGIFHGDTIDAVCLLLGAMRVGIVPVTVNGRYKARELEHVARHAGMRLLLVDEGGAATARQAELECRVVHLDDSALAAGEARVSTDAAARAADAVAADDDAIILYTSGTTAAPKGCVYLHEGLTAQAFALAGAMELAPADVLFTPLPLYHVSAIVALGATLAAPCLLVHVGRRFEPGPALDLLERERCTISFTAFETIWMPVLNEPRFAEADLDSLRLTINVGTPGSLRRMQERLPQVPQVSAFGGTESGGFAALGRPDDPLEARVTTSGRALPGYELRAVDPETGVDVVPGETGELLIRGLMRFHRYHDDPEATAAVIDSDGWYHSGDLGRIDADGRVSFVGRLKDTLKVGGENVAAAEIETFLLAHPAVEIAQVVGAPDARYIEVPAAFVQLAPGTGATEAELIDYCLGEIATFKVPRYVRFVTEWPMSGTKIQKFKLREQIASELDLAGITEAPRLAPRRSASP